MNLSEQISEQLKAAMKAKDQATLRSLRAIKAALLLLKTSGSEPTEADEVAALVKMAKQRRDSIEIFRQQNREDLAVIEEEELAVIETFLPKQLTDEELAAEIKTIIAQTGASGMADMGKVMGMASQKLKGKADGKAIADKVKALLAG
ncbi:MAG: GatB/YqeY domain-containing protein [Flavobacteriales bacterium]|nr:GatB/YqeY domain-containing protein [Flavobacteriales bacterium]